MNVKRENGTKISSESYGKGRSLSEQFLIEK